MPASGNRDVSCPHCSAVVKTQMSPQINPQENPELRKCVLSETLFEWKCPNCGYEAEMMYPCLYHDKNNKFMVYISPNGANKLQSLNMEETYPRLNGVTKRVVTSVKQLKEKIVIFENGLNDIAIELVKFALSDVAKKKHNKNVTNGYFSYIDSEEDKIYFSFFLKNQDSPVLQGTKMDAYRKSVEITESVGKIADNNFIFVDSAFAENILQEYHNQEE